ncbi:MAG: aryl-sulfate sulfotransferase [Alphaproteobacteria bacterium]|nr:aryl-sulfate sulfotransferase [Alphaproteobacteria bacterium]
MLIKRSLSIAGHRTSLALEPDFWAVLDAVAEQRGIAFAALIRDIDEARAAANPDQPLSSACRVFALRAVQSQAG